MSHPAANIYLEQDSQDLNRLVDIISEARPDYEDQLRLLTNSWFWEIMVPEAQEAYTVLLREAVEEDNVDSTLKMLFLEDPGPFLIEPSPEWDDLIRKFSKGHIELYTPLAKLIAQKIIADDEQRDETYGPISWNYLIKGPMYSGKNTLTTFIYEELVAAGYDVRDGIAANLNEHEVTARSLGRLFGDPNAIREAIPVGANYLKVIEFLKNERDNNGGKKMVFILDEASLLQFIDPAIVPDFVNRLNAEGIRVILSGLDQDFKGRPFESFKEENLPGQMRVHNLKSFIPVFNEDGAPHGTESVRYIRIGDDKDGKPVYVRDFAGETVIPRHLWWLVIYSSGLPEHSMQLLFAHHPELLKILNGYNSEEVKKLLSRYLMGLFTPPEEEGN